MPECRRVYIIGFMGSGKSTTGKKLAAKLGWSFIDLDREIELQTGQTINDLFSHHGENHFRIVETKTLRKLKPENDSIIAMGGGAPCFDDNMDFMLQTGLVVYLRMTAGQLKSRLAGLTGDRPLLTDISKEKLLPFISNKLFEREKHYNRASIIVDGINLNIRSLSKIIMEWNV